MTKIHYSIIAIIAVSLAAYLIGSLYAKEEAWDSAFDFIKGEKL